MNEAAETTASVDPGSNVEKLSPSTTLESALRISWPHLYLGMIGFALSLYSFRLHVKIKPLMHQIEVSGVCPFEDLGFDCAGVMGSKYGELFGIPLGIYGMVFFVIVIITGVTTNAKTSEVEASLWRLLATTVGFLGSVALLYISHFILHKMCSVCLGIHITNLLLFAASVYGYLRARKMHVLSTVDESLPTNDVV